LRAPPESNWLPALRLADAKHPLRSSFADAGLIIAVSPTIITDQ
jgi:hypothetical protein